MSQPNRTPRREQDAGNFINCTFQITSLGQTYLKKILI